MQGLCLLELHLQPLYLLLRMQQLLTLLPVRGLERLCLVLPLLQLLGQQAELLKGGSVWR